MCLAIIRPILCPKGAVGLSPGFQPWEPSPKRRALKGRQIERNNPTKARFGCNMAQLLAPLAPSGRTFDSLVPRVETLGYASYGPFGAGAAVGKRIHRALRSSSQSESLDSHERV